MQLASFPASRSISLSCTCTYVQVRSHARTQTRVHAFLHTFMLTQANTTSPIRIPLHTCAHSQAAAAAHFSSVQQQQQQQLAANAGPPFPSPPSPPMGSTLQAPPGRGGSTAPAGAYAGSGRGVYAAGAAARAAGWGGPPGGRVANMAVRPAPLCD